MSKYIIEVGDAYTKHICGKGDMLCLPVRINEFEDNWLNTNIPLTPYTEPDLERVRLEAYEKGLSDAWEAAKKIQDTGGNLNWWIHNVSAPEAIEKIRQHEQEKEEQAQVGDEVECDDERYVVLQKYLNNIDELMVVLFNRRKGEINKWHLYNADGVIFKKTGRHFPEIATVLAKMKEN